MNQIWKSCVSLLFMVALSGSQVAIAASSEAKKKETESSWPSWKTISVTGGVATLGALFLTRLFARNVGAPVQNARPLPAAAEPAIGFAAAAANLFDGGPNAGDINARGDDFGASEPLPVAELTRVNFGVQQTVVLEEQEEQAVQHLQAFMTPERPVANGEPTNLLVRNFEHRDTPIPDYGSNRLTFRVRTRDSFELRNLPQLNLEEAQEAEEEEEEEEEEVVSDTELARELVESLFQPEEEPVRDQTQRTVTPLAGRTVTLMFDQPMDEDEEYEIVRLLQTPNPTGEFLELQDDEQPVAPVMSPLPPAVQQEPILLVVEAPAANNNAVVENEDRAPAPARTPKARGRTVRKPTKADRRAAEEAQRLMSTIKPRTERKKPLRSYKDESDNEGYEKSDSDGGDFSELNKKLF